MVKLIAKKRLRYPRGGTAGVEYRPGDVFEASDGDAKALKLVRYAADAPAGAAARANVTDIPKAAVAKAKPEEDVAALRGEYETKVGKRPFMGWDAATLRDKLNSYERRDMRARE